MTRMMLTDAQWAKMAPHSLGKKSDPGRAGGDGRLLLEAVDKFRSTQRRQARSTCCLNRWRIHVSLS